MNAGGMPKTCKSYEVVLRSRVLAQSGQGLPLSGARVSNTWVIYPRDWDNSWKRLLIPDVLYGVKEPLKLRLEMGLRCIS